MRGWCRRGLCSLICRDWVWCGSMCEMVEDGLMAWFGLGDLVFYGQASNGVHSE